MDQETALAVALEVQEAIKDLPHLYVSIIIKESGIRQVVIRKKGGTRC